MTLTLTTRCSWQIRHIPIFIVASVPQALHGLSARRRSLGTIFVYDCSGSSSFWAPAAYHPALLQ